MTDPYEIIERPLLTEKSVAGAGIGKYTFRVRKTANKIEIGKAVEKVFNVKVDGVNTMIVKGKKKRLGRHPEGKTADWKKAIVTLKPGYKIEVFEGM
ncbi:MAG TPA: 50S ribosomal protein L23 [Armatimonadota bacterium]|nr:50S ribosomal protein L23 [Armatimonadota bacterium]